MINPIVPTTTVGARLPFAALPQTEFLTVENNDVPWLDELLAPGSR